MTTTPSGRRSGRSAVLRLGPTGRIPPGRSSSPPPNPPRRAWPNGSYRFRNGLSPVERADWPSRSTNARNRSPAPVPGGGARRPASQTLTRRKTSAIASPSANSPACAPIRVQNTGSKPTLLNQVASVTSWIPNPTRKMALSRISATTARTTCGPMDRSRGPPPSRGPPGPRRRGGAPDGGPRWPPASGRGRSGDGGSSSAPSEGPRSGRSVSISSSTAGGPPWACVESGSSSEPASPGPSPGAAGCSPRAAAWAWRWRSASSFMKSSNMSRIGQSVRPRPGPPDGARAGQAVRAGGGPRPPAGRRPAPRPPGRSASSPQPVPAPSGWLPGPRAVPTRHGRDPPVARAGEGGSAGGHHPRGRSRRVPRRGAGRAARAADPAAVPRRGPPPGKPRSRRHRPPRRPRATSPRSPSDGPCRPGRAGHRARPRARARTRGRVVGGGASRDRIPALRRVPGPG